MSAITFPASPSVNDTYTVGSQMWKWTGVVWAIVSLTSPVQSPTAPSNPFDGMQWQDTSTMSTYYRYNGQWVEYEGVGATGAAPTGSVLQTVYAEYSTNASITSILPADDTVPQISEGTEILTASITPSSSSNTILITVNGLAMTNSYDVAAVGAIFQDSIASAIHPFATSGAGYGAYGGYVLSAIKKHAPSTTSAITYRLRVGPGIAGTLRMNGMYNSRWFGGSAAVTLTLQEIKG